MSQGKISREEVARICMAALSSPNAVGKTFEVKTPLLVRELGQNLLSCHLWENS
jgi:hypothetical protein